MLSIDLPPDVAAKLEDISESQKISPSEIVQQLIQQYLDAYFGRITAYDLGKDLFGKYGSGKDAPPTSNEGKLND